MIKKNGNVLKTGLMALSIAGVSMFMSCVSTNNVASVTNDWRKESYLNGIVYQLSAEVRGLQYQAFELAKIRLDQRIAEEKDGKYDRPIAIISDIDDTLASDCSYMAGIVTEEGEWDAGPWNGYYESIASTSNTPIPGAIEFMKYAASKGVEIFYITNRENDKDDLTVAQLKRFGFPNADAEHVQVCDPSGSSNKTKRRDNVTANYDVVMYIGDNIGDFTASFEREMGAVKRSELASSAEYKENWGDKWIVLPNATYGDYAGAVWENDKTLSAAKRAQAVKDLLYKFSYRNTEDYEQWYDGE